LNAYRRASFYQAVGYDPQEITLENKSIFENIRMGREAVGVEDVMLAARAAMIHEEIMRMPMAYETLISEFGANLSGGQRQRIALARAILTKAQVLILTSI
jgi:ABC-type bacteriocin/lantibiotic exporter with double-glycine peptidase domain